MTQYHKIQTVFNRDPSTNHKTLLLGEWAKPEFDYLKRAEWFWTEKVDGTNIRVMWNGEGVVSFGGKTDDAHVPTPLLQHLMSTFTPDRCSHGLRGPIVLYGEGYGAKIQKGGGRYRPDAGFILFDARAGDVWLERLTVEDIATALSIPIAPIVGRGNLLSAIEYAATPWTSEIAQDSSLIAEGLVMRPLVELKDRLGHRVITKIKYKDFAAAK